ncbi:hypothetical protein PF010_g25994 [Phytophthora fragariae]|uniref:Secreted protein n=1 Tax=Phytophthora fragariae TaxID=53985 RepID=A0A6A3HSC8_9STRA|nr:hypothetical protein PF011_g25869 [Phytophthora fragariae]KAE9071134.1 hypothetical protein PF010_g25994 [Phytophthora fragariae]KAE9178840.1 hypothetical protein PF004_g25357 [Phytophthora fragariae]
MRACVSFLGGTVSGLLFEYCCARTAVQQSNVTVSGDECCSCPSQFSTSRRRIRGRGATTGIDTER